ncbi:MAG TPA: Crp/Fnr family transcriptional regulator [Candidatus Acidoferrales bacterium]|jgi:CRP-like cAMP-binding protein|nr:Crp/Fnr family transcriptional regulator [Candidatus Acidoferrales bacterium]
MAVNRRANGSNGSSDRQASAAQKQQVENEILLKIPRSEFNAIFTKLEAHAFPARTILLEPEKPIENCYFLNRGVASIIHVMSDGRSVEVGLTGKEGFVGLPALVDYESSPVRAVIQIDASGYKIGLKQFKAVLLSCPVLAKLLSQYSQDLAVQSIQIAACNRLHSVDRQLARWLLMSQDRVGESTFCLTQEFISHMLGTRRASVSVAASVLQKRGLITYTRGQVSINDRQGLEKASCECYRAITGQLEAWRKA